ncbi:MAG: amidohydrolase family protein [Promethearchaeota archaeon]|jgi:cytosine/adenosine deaminase-related metal-dependent hydrolase
MPLISIFSEYALIGENLELKQDVSIEVNENGTIAEISYKNPEHPIKISESNHCYLLLPSFINSHTHIGDNFAKEIGFNKELTEIVAPPFGLKHKLLRQTTKDVIIKGIKKAALEMLSNGITFFIDFREGGVEGVNLIKKALEHSPINCLILGRFMDESEIDLIFSVADGIGLSSYKRISNSTKTFLRKSKQNYQKLIACHCAEKNRIPDLINRVVNDNLIDIIIHGTKFTKEDLVGIQKAMKSLVLCPRCNGYFGVGFPPITEIIKLGIPISLGTDNSMVNNSDLFEEMRYLYRISRVLGNYNKSIHLTSKELLKMVTINAARNFHLESERGSISEGKLADFFAIDLKEPNFYTLNLNESNVFDVIVQRTGSANIKRTYIRGEVVFERN